MSFYEELQKRNVLRVAVAYVVASWLVIQVVETLFPVFGFSDAAIRLVVIVLAIGFVPVLILSWAFELTPDGLKLEKELAKEEGSAARDNKKLDRIILVVLAVALGYFAFDKFVLDPARDAEFVEEMTEEIRSDVLLGSYGDKSIAVLPFVDMSPNKDQEYMSDGIAEELLNLLARIPDLRVVSRSSAFAFKGKDINIPDVAQKLNVAYVLEGSVRLAGNQLRITAQLIDAATDTHRWSETYDRKLDNIFQIQDEISAQVVEQLKITLLGDAPRSQQIDEQAYKLALQARYLWNRRGDGDADQVLKLYLQALELAPEYAPAWAGVSIAYYDRTSKGKIPREAGLRLAREAAEKAYELDPNSAESQVRMGQTWGRMGEHAKQREAYRRALELDPNHPTALSVSANAYAACGNFEKAIEMYVHAESVDPMGALWPGALANLYISTGRFEKAEAAIDRTYDLNGSASGYLADMSHLYGAQGRYEELVEMLESRREDWPKEGFFLSTTYMSLAIAYHQLGRFEEAEAMAAKLDDEDHRFEPYFTAIMYAKQGRLDEAFAHLPEVAKRFPRHYVEFESSFSSMVDDPRWLPALQQFEQAAYLCSE